MTTPVARIGDSSSHGGAITSGAAHAKDDGIPIARVTDILACPIHGAQPIVTGCPVWKIEGQPVARSGSVAACGAVIIGGSFRLKCSDLMPDAALDWNGDFALTPAGDLALADRDDLVKQRLLRRLLTAVRGYVFHLDYGAGLPQKIGSTLGPRTVESVVRAQLALEAAVATSPPATVSVSEPRAGLQVVAIQYTDALTGQHVSLDLSI